MECPSCSKPVLQAISTVLGGFLVLYAFIFLVMAYKTKQTMGPPAEKRRIERLEKIEKDYGPRDTSMAGYTKLVNTTYSGGDIKSIRDKPLSECQAECNKNEACMGVAWNREDEECTLKKALKKSVTHKEFDFYKQDDLPSLPGYTAHKGINYSKGELLHKTGLNIQSCQKLCSANDKCVGVQWNTQLHQCWLKKQLATGGPQKNPTRTYYSRDNPSGPGYTTQTATDYASKSLASYPAKSLIDCQKSCTSNKKCKAVVIDNNTRKCWLKSTLRSKKTNKRTNSYVKGV